MKRLFLVVLFLFEISVSYAQDDWDSEYRNIHFSPQGDLMAFNKQESVFIADTDGTGARLISTDVIGSVVSFSPDGKNLLLWNFSESQMIVLNTSGVVLHVVEIEGQPKRIVWETGSSGFVFHATETLFYDFDTEVLTSVDKPNGEVVAWNKSQDEIVVELHNWHWEYIYYVINSQGEVLRSYMNVAGEQYHRCAFNYNTNQIACVYANLNGHPVQQDLKIFSLGPVVELTYRFNVGLYGCLQYLEPPVWSPDGKRVFVRSHRHVNCYEENQVGLFPVAIVNLQTEQSVMPKLLDRKRSYGIQWGPGGVVFFDKDGEYFTYDLESGETTSFPQ